MEGMNNMYRYCGRTGREVVTAVAMAWRGVNTLHIVWREVPRRRHAEAEKALATLLVEAEAILKAAEDAAFDGWIASVRYAMRSAFRSADLTAGQVEDILSDLTGRKVKVDPMAAVAAIKAARRHRVVPTWETMLSAVQWAD